jgi:hypothetical protein
MHQYQDLISIFKQTFYAKYKTVLVKGDAEPVYLPASEQCPHNQIIFAHGYYASALHEIAHWCLAGEKRRLLEDFGYWYIPDGRNSEQQKAFEQVEVKPQAIEWAFCMAAKKTFYVSADNLNGSGGSDTQLFQQRVEEQVALYCEHGFPKDAQLFIEALAEFYHTNAKLTLADFYYGKTQSPILLTKMFTQSREYNEI